MKPRLFNRETLGRQLFLLRLQALDLAGATALAKKLYDLITYGAQHRGQNQGYRDNNNRDVAVTKTCRPPLPDTFRYKDNVHLKRYRPGCGKLP